MIFDGKPTTEITSVAIEALLRDRVEEDAFLDYKARSYTRDETGIHELVKDVSALANAQGGYLIFGIGEESGAPRRPGGLVNIDDVEGERRRIIDHCFEKIEPRLTELDIRSIVVAGKTLLICRVLEGAQKPYCARPNKEHHYFWRRYEDGNRLMSVAEIRDCLEGDRVPRELAEVRREIGLIRQHQLVSRESEQEIHEDNLFQFQTIERFRAFVDQQFEQEANNLPYYRLAATMLPISAVSLRNQAGPIRELLDNPPELRRHGWDMSTYSRHETSITALGVLRNDLSYKHLRVLWNGHTEFWTKVEDAFFRFSETSDREVERKFFYPYAISEPIENFLMFVREVCRIAKFAGEIELRFGFYRIGGYYLAPGPPESIGYRMARSDAGHPFGAKPFGSANLIVPPIQFKVDEIPDAITWRIVSQVYARFGYTEVKQVPFFDNENRFILGRPQAQREIQ